ncbi:hypothetical protein MC7420_3252 [Coleofasciculus chthonoplastes PCC 7420]|uniref:Uncharacterized protein n=1 Tax=Coleofasciculus chthonoplastes PCC 7420 TaxID=118168 RepID=B4VZ01_9CYAN|nr:hypothetical protein MC7420_3252 [Coleofasciculus chthonoplastes PCC 7420]
MGFVVVGRPTHRSPASEFPFFPEPLTKVYLWTQLKLAVEIRELLTGNS